MATLSLHLAAAAQGIDDALIQPYSGHESRQSLEQRSKIHRESASPKNQAPEKCM